VYNAIIDSTHHRELVYTEIAPLWGKSIVLFLNEALDGKRARICDFTYLSLEDITTQLQKSFGSESCPLKYMIVTKNGIMILRIFGLSLAF
jgi:hypothetical protein